MDTRGDVRRDPPGRGQRLPCGHHARQLACTWKAFRAITTTTYWGPVSSTLSEENVVMCRHIGTGFGAISIAPVAPIDNMIILATEVSAMCAQDLLRAGDAQIPRPEVRFLEGGIGWIPFYLDRSDRHYTTRSGCAATSADSCPADVFREHSLACYVTDKTVAEAAPRTGIDIIAWNATTHSTVPGRRPRTGARRTDAAGSRRQRHQQDHLAETPATSSAGICSPHAARAGQCRRATGQGRRTSRVDSPTQGVGAPLRAKAAG